MIPFVQINFVLAALVGFGLHGVTGAAIGALSWLFVVVVLHLAGRSGPRRAALALARLGLTVARRGIGLIAFPFLLVIGIVIGFATLARRHLDAHLPALPVVRRPRPSGEPLLAFLRSWTEPRSIAMTIANVVALIAIGCIAIGMEVALFVALGAVPVILLVLMMLAVDSSEEPEDEVA